MNTTNTIIRSYIELRRQLTLNSVDPAMVDKILNFEIYIRGDSMAEYNDATLRYPLKHSLAVYIYDKEKVKRIMDYFFPEDFVLKYSNNRNFTKHY
jgi:hypothetical protein